MLQNWKLKEAYFLVESRKIPARRADTYNDGDEPVIELARKQVALHGGSLRVAIRKIREERRERARDLALAEAPRANRRDDGSYARVSSDPRWPFGIEDEQVVAPFGLSNCGLPRTVDPEKKRNGPRANALAARTEAREIIMAKLERMGCDPIRIMAELAMDPEEKSEVRLRAASDLATMIYPRLRGVEATKKSENTVFVIGVPAEQPATADAWLSNAHGVRQIAQAVSEAEDVIDGEAKIVADS